MYTLCKVLDKHFMMSSSHFETKTRIEIIYIETMSMRENKTLILIQVHFFSIDTLFHL